ncbi:hypothetical protein ABC255_08855 [Neobacillus sp. 3P2-tot-E-2]|uniref:hypothetical protein n=1 Tax=Neobacillus sp. 3P2-tot-E-2 TaxID=3132212 RepID=UPI0039A2A8E0
MNKRKKYKISLSTEPPKQQYSEEEVKKLINKAVNLIIDELMLKTLDKTAYPLEGINHEN